MKIEKTVFEYSRGNGGKYMYKVFLDEKAIPSIRFQLDPFPGCCGVGVIHHIGVGDWFCSVNLRLSPEQIKLFTEKFIEDILETERFTKIWFIGNVGYDGTNFLEAIGFKQIERFKNRRTRNLLVKLELNLPYKNEGFHPSNKSTIADPIFDLIDLTQQSEVGSIVVNEDSL